MVELELLRDSVLFSGFGEQDLNRLGEIAVMREYADGELVFSHGTEARELMVIASGKIQLELPVSVFGETRSIVFETKGFGNVVGWSTLVPPNRFTLSGRASDCTRVVALGKEDLTALLDIDPAFGCRVLKNVLSIMRLRLERTHNLWVHEIQQSLDDRYR